MESKNNLLEEYKGYSNKETDALIESIINNPVPLILSVIKNIDYYERVSNSKGKRDGKDSFFINCRSLITMIMKKINNKEKISWKDAITLSTFYDMAKGLFKEILINKDLNNLFIGTNSGSEKVKAIHNNYLINIIIPLDNETRPLFKIELYDYNIFYHAMIEGISLFRTVKNPKFESDLGYKFPVTLWNKKGGVSNLWITGEFEQQLEGLPNIEKNLHLFIRNYISNLHSLILHPEVEIIKKDYFNNENRIKRGQVAIPTKYFINLTGKLKKYVNETTQQNEKAWELGHRFWVRGHWMEFKHIRYKNKQGQKTWVLPYIKGKGELVKKDYYIGDKEQCWENEKQMIKIIRELYPEHEVKTHDRTTLDGLEIDCYIPELKLGFEYNGKQHYEHIEFFHKTIEEFEAQKNRDIEKLKRAESKGIKIIIIKYNEAVIKDVLSKKLI